MDSIRRRSAGGHHFLLLLVLRWAAPAVAGDPYAYYEWEVSYVSGAPLGGVKQEAIGINGQLPGPALNVTTNWNLVVNVRNGLDEPLLLTWHGVQQRKGPWQDGVGGTNCGIPPGWNWTFQFHVKDQVGSFFYAPSTALHRAAGGYGAITINNRDVIPLPFPLPDGGDMTLLLADWYARDHRALRRALDAGEPLGPPDGVLINALGPYRYNDTLVPPGVTYERINVDQSTRGGPTACACTTSASPLASISESRATTCCSSRPRAPTLRSRTTPTWTSMSASPTPSWSPWTRTLLLHYSNSQGPPSGPLSLMPQMTSTTPFSPSTKQDQSDGMLQPVVPAPIRRAHSITATLPSPMCTCCRACHRSS